MNDCVFCKIVSGEIPSKFIYEDDDIVVFNDINPVARVHLLVVPKRHISSVASMALCDTDLFGRIIYVAKLVADKMNLSGYRLTFNVGKDGGQEVFHVHLHLIAN